MAKLLWIALMSFASKTSPQPYPGRNLLCKMLGGTKVLNLETYYKYRQELIDGGYLRPENQILDEGRFSTRCYTLGIPEKDCKQKSEPCPEKPYTVKPHTVQPYPESSITKSTSLKEVPNQEKKTTTTRAASAASGGVPASRGNGKITAEGLASAFLNLWCQDHKTWFGTKYRVREQDQEELTSFFQDYQDEKARPLDLLFVARKMWIATKDWNEPKTGQKDPWFSNIRGQRNLRFFCRYFDRIVEEQGDSAENIFNRITQREVDELEHLIQEGRGAE